jgi:hypothetical protein
MGMWQHHSGYEEKSDELADELALKLTGRPFNELTPDAQYDIWSKAEESVRNDMITAAEYQREAREGR